MKRIIAWVVLLAGAAALAAYVAWPRPLAVETARVVRGAVAAGIAEEAMTRLDDDYLVTMPVAGRLLRIALQEGDVVHKGDVVARIDTFDRDEQLKQLDARVREIQALIVGVDKAKPKPEDLRRAELVGEEASLRVEAARKALDNARIDFEQEAKQYERYKGLLAEGAIAQSVFDESQRRYLTLKARRDEAGFHTDAAQTQLEQARVALKRLRDSADDNEYQRSMYQAQIAQTDAQLAVLRDELGKSAIHAPVSGPVLDRYQRDVAVLAAGTPLLRLGDLASIRVEADILSEEVGRVRVGQDVDIRGPAVGDQPILGKVERIYPGGFKKISSLGIEQQRVKVIFAFDNRELALRPGVRVDVHIITERRTGVLLAPDRALFKQGDAWRVFIVRDGRACVVPVAVGLRNDESAEILSGLREGDTVIPSPPTDLTDGAAVVGRATR